MPKGHGRPYNRIQRQISIRRGGDIPSEVLNHVLNRRRLQRMDGSRSQELNSNYMGQNPRSSRATQARNRYNRTGRRF